MIFFCSKNLSANRVHVSPHCVTVTLHSLTHLHICFAFQPNKKHVLKVQVLPLKDFCECVCRFLVVVAAVNRGSLTVVNLTAAVRLLADSDEYIWIRFESTWPTPHWWWSGQIAPWLIDMEMDISCSRHITGTIRAHWAYAVDLFGLRFVYLDLQLLLPQFMSH